MKNKNILFEIAKAARDNINRKQFKDVNNFSEQDIDTAIENALNNKNELIELKKILYPNKILISEEFFEKFSEFYVLCGFNEKTRILCAEITKIIFEEIEEKQVYELLDILCITKQHFFWYYLGILHFLLERYPLKSEYASEWFWKMTKKIGNDLSGGDFYFGIEGYAHNFPDVAHRTIELIIKQNIDDTNIFIVSILLGGIRTNKNYSITDEFTNLENIMKYSSIAQLRTTYFSSYWVTFKRNGADLLELEHVLTELINDKNQEVRERQFYLIEGCIKYYPTDKKLINFIIPWIKNNIKNISDLAQYNIISTLRWIGWKFKVIDDYNIVKELNRILPLILPIELKNKGTWKELDDYLVSLFNYNNDLFDNAVYSIVEHSGRELIEIIKEDYLSFLTHTLIESNYTEFIFPLLINEKREIRETGFILTQKFGLSIPKKYINNKLSDKQLYILLYSTSLYHLASEKIGDFLLTIEPLFANLESEIKNELMKEMVFQAINFPGACLEKWEKKEIKSELLNTVIASAKSYFENLQKSKDLSVNSIYTPEIVKGDKEWMRNFSSKVSQGAKEKSIFLKLVRTTEVLYGNEWSIYDNNKSIHEPSRFGEYKHSFEWPRLELIDPEGMVLRRKFMNFKIKNL